jgi:pilus assembly protein CpaB
MRGRRRRGLILLALALASGGLAATQVRQRERDVEAKVGPLVPVIVAARDLAPDEPVAGRDLAVERVPARFVPPDALGSPDELAGARTAVPVTSGSYLTAGLLQGAGRGEGGSLLPGQRALEIGVSGGAALTGVAPGARVDVVLSTQSGEGSGRTFVALEDVELLGLRESGADGFAAEPDTGSAPDSALATLRVTLRQAVYLAAADNFGHELRLLVRPPEDRRSAAGYAVAEGEL